MKDFKSISDKLKTLSNLINSQCLLNSPTLNLIVPLGNVLLVLWAFGAHCKPVLTATLCWLKKSEKFSGEYPLILQEIIVEPCFSS